eukprot:TRINITY_DN58736_c0_g1_i1.p1 TRINITY_DN58736_c0_g1~~TRINITY_DN58736_c0_g1_i1.p1  ORF type:complete len:172 (+),score=21.56 TRINITY_DN58736_c0_g1_i1:221-736(+)
MIAVCSSSKSAGSAERTEAVWKKMVQELGEIDVFSIRVNGLSGPLGSIRGSRKWNWYHVKQEIERAFGWPADSQNLIFGAQVMPDSGLVESTREEGAHSIELSIVNAPGSQVAHDAVLEFSWGDERFAHVNFESLYDVVAAEASSIRGTSPLFRFRRSLLQDFARSGAGSA